MMKKNNHLVHVITGLQRGGAEMVLITLARELTQKKYHQSVVFFKDGPLRQELEALGIKTYLVSYIIAPVKIAQLRPTQIHSSLWSANIIARIAGYFLSIPVVCSLHTVAQHSGFIRNTVDYLIDNLSPFGPQRYIAVSPLVKQSYNSLLGDKKIVVIENGVSPFTLIAAHKKKNRYTIGTIGRFVAVKNYHLLITLFARLHKEFPTTHLMLVGHGPLEQELRALVKNLAINDAVTFVINQPGRDYYSFFDCFIQPSAYEGYGLAAAEALHAGIPLIVTGYNRNHPFVVHHISGLVIEPHDSHALYQALKFYLLNQQTAQHYAQIGKNYARKNFSSAVMAKKYLLLILSLKKARYVHL